jgi:hypothetical protein
MNRHWLTGAGKQSGKHLPETLVQMEQEIKKMADFTMDRGVEQPGSSSGS